MRIEATPACGEILDRILPGYFELIGRISAILDDSEKADLERITKRLRDGLDNSITPAFAPVNRVQNEPAYAI